MSLLKRICLPALFVLLMLAGCSGSDGADEAAADMTLCDCVTSPIDSDARNRACRDIIEAMPPEQMVAARNECFADLPVPAAGPDVCFCVRTTTQDAAIIAACESLLEGLSAAEATAKVVECGSQ